MEVRFMPTRQCAGLKSINRVITAKNHKTVSVCRIRFCDLLQKNVIINVFLTKTLKRENSIDKAANM